MLQERPHDGPPAPIAPARLEFVDLLRGLVIILMALDHTRHFFSSLAFAPEDLQRTNPALFLTRWITHLCAPVFVLLAGIGAYLATTRGRTKRELSWFLVSRGLWLVLLELLWVNWVGWRFHVNIFSYGLQVIAAIGCAMIVLAGLVQLPRWAVISFAVALIGFHNTLDGIKTEGTGGWSGLWHLFYASGPADIAGLHFEVGYPLIPWLGVMAFGYALGPVMLFDRTRRRKWLVLGGAGLTALFFLLRSINGYGDPFPWSTQPDFRFTIFSFLNCTKYPPSLCYELMTLGPALLLLALFDRGTPKLLKPLLVFGRVPLFFYLVHLPFIHVLSMLARRVWFDGADASTAGFGLAAVYLFWILIVVLLYPLCRWFAEYKRTHRDAWLNYL